MTETLGGGENSRMRSNGYESDLSSCWPVAPKDSVRAWSFVLSVGLEDFLPRLVRVGYGAVFVGIEAWMSGVFT
jgi:hypothetical protein